MGANSLGIGALFELFSSSFISKKGRKNFDIVEETLTNKI